MRKRDGKEPAVDYRKSALIFDICWYAGLASIVLALIMYALWLVILGAVLLFAGLIQAGLFYRCPHCGKSIDIRARSPKYCQECGGKLFSSK